MATVVNGKNQNLASLLDRIPIAHKFLISELTNSLLNLKIMFMSWNVSDFDPLAANLLPKDLKEFGIEFLVISLADHPTSVLDDRFYHTLNQTGMPYLILTSYHDPDTRTLYCPSWMILFPNMIHGQNPSIEQAANSNRQYNFSCLNNKFKIERILLLIEMYRHPTLFNNSIVTMNNLVTEWHPEGSSDVHIKQLDFLLDNNVKAEYLDILHDQIIPALPLTHPGTALSNGDFFSCDNPAYTESQINIVTEYGSQTAFVSEKSIKPLLAGQFFVNTSGNGTVQLLRDAGFDTYDDIVNHSVYEHDRVFPRISNLIRYLTVIKDNNWAELYKETESRRLANRELLLSRQIEKNFLRRLEEKIYEIL
jgi:uncharacterized protein